MKSPAPGTRVYLCCQPVDLRKGFNGLVAHVANVLRADPYGGHLFAFRGKRGDCMKVLYWDGSGLWICGKRLQRGCFCWPETSPGEVKIRLTAEEFAMLIGGMDVQTAKRRPWYRKEIDEVVAPRINPA